MTPEKITATPDITGCLLSKAKMDEYPPCSLDFCLPLAVLLGLPSNYAQESALDPEYKEGAVLIRSDPPPVEGDQVAALIQYIRNSDASGLPWNGRETKNIKYKFRFRTAGRVRPKFPYRVVSYSDLS